MFFAPLKFLATLASSLSGIPGGIFAPSLSIGASLGGLMASLLPTTPVGALGVLGMAAFLTGVVQAPITAFVIASEMTESHALVIPLMLTSLTAQAAARVVCRRGLYLSRIRCCAGEAPRSGTARPHSRDASRRICDRAPPAWRDDTHRSNVSSRRVLRRLGVAPDAHETELNFLPPGAWAQPGRILAACGEA